MSPVVSSSQTDSPLPGHVGNLSIKETDLLKQLWVRLFKLFEQEGTEFTPVVVEEKKESKKGGWFSKKEPAAEKEVFIGTTTNPEWLSLPLEKGLPLVPGHLLQSTFWNMVSIDNPDAVCLRFLRARKWDLDAAYDMLANTLRWRLVMRVDDIIALGENGIRDELNRLSPDLGNTFTTQLNSGKAYLGGPDKDGRGICFINVKDHQKEDQPFEIIKLLTMYIMETSRCIVHQPVESSCIVFNMDGFTLKNMDFDFVKFLLSCFEAYYPETLGSCLIHKAPWVFSTVWSIIQPLLDPVVATKIHFTKGPDDIAEFVDVSALPSNITGEKDKKTLDESVQVDPVAPGTLAKPTSAAFAEYQETIRDYSAKTLAWSEQETTEEGDACARHELARKYRLARIKTEKDLRGPTSYEAKGLLTITPENRVILNFGSEGWVPLDITEMV